MKYLSYILTTLLGPVFLVSAFAKAWDADQFADLLLQYGWTGFSIAVPVIVFTEAVLGVLLLLRYRPCQSALAAVVFLFIVSLGYAYGVLFKGIEDCGCFGSLSRLYNSRPWMTFVRNAVLMICGAIIIIGEKQKTKVERPLCSKTKDRCAQRLLHLIALFVGAVVCFCCGLGMKRSYSLPKILVESQKSIVERPEIEQLAGIYPFSPDSTYAVYLFSFTCLHCQNYFANVEQYEQMQVVDKVIGIAIENTHAQERFERLYQPQIEILTISHNTMAGLTRHLPTLLIIRNGSIEKTEQGFVTSPGIYMP